MNVPDDVRGRGRWRAPLLVACAVIPFVTVVPREFTNWDDHVHVSQNGAVPYPTVTNL